MYKVTGDDDDDEAAIESYRQHILRLNKALVRRGGSVGLSDRCCRAEARRMEDNRAMERAKERAMERWRASALMIV